MSSSTEQPPPSGRVRWSQVRKANSQRLSEPTNELIAKLRDEMSLALGSLYGRDRMSADLIIFASMRIAMRDPKALAAECRAVMAGDYPAPLPHYPGE